MNKYHREVFWKEGFDTQSIALFKAQDIRISTHLYEQIERRDKKHRIDYNKLFDILDWMYYNEFSPFEVEVDGDGMVDKFVVRLVYDDTRDISVVVRKGLIVTAWLNHKDDDHTAKMGGSGLETDKYVKEHGGK